MAESLASVVEYFDADLDHGGRSREFIPTAEFIDALNVEPAAFGRQMGELGYRAGPGRITTEDSTSRQVRGYRIADIRAAIQTQRNDPEFDSPA